MLAQSLVAKRFVDYQSEQESEPGGEESGSVAIGLGEESRHKRSEQRAYVYAHVEYGECGVYPSVVRLVQLSDDYGDVRFEESVADDGQTGRTAGISLLFSIYTFIKIFQLY